jgi:hypothetical protein
VLVSVGTVKLENIALKSSAFDSLGLPITLVQGTIGLVELHVPWKSLRTSHVVVNIKDLNAILGPNVSHIGNVHIRFQSDILHSLFSRMKGQGLFPLCVRCGSHIARATRCSTL